MLLQHFLFIVLVEAFCNPILFQCNCLPCGKIALKHLFVLRHTVVYTNTVLSHLPFIIIGVRVNVYFISTNKFEWKEKQKDDRFLFFSLYQAQGHNLDGKHIFFSLKKGRKLLLFYLNCERKKNTFKQLSRKPIDKKSNFLPVFYKSLEIRFNFFFAFKFRIYSLTLKVMLKYGNYYQWTTE